jgi:hypothetical protein
MPEGDVREVNIVWIAANCLSKKGDDMEAQITISYKLSAFS